jgi:uncharacterized protein with HEPN domain
MKDHRLYLIHVQDCIARIGNYTQGGKDEFMGNGMIQDAVVAKFRNHGRVGEEAAGRVEAVSAPG